VSDFATKVKFDRWRPYYFYLPTIRALRDFEALFVIQAPYLAYLSERPYIATHMGGEIWFECSRDDLLGRLQRAAFEHANLLIASNPWSFAFARRYGFSNLVCMPTLLDPDRYAPGTADLRDQWIEEVGGDFFVLTTARVDDLFKGSNLALEGFRLFCEKNPNARLVLIGWGADRDTHVKRIKELGLCGKVIWLPPAGKKRLLRYLRSAHVLLDQFILGYFGMTALEAMAVSTPIVMRLEDAQYAEFLHVGPPPVINASNASGIAQALSALSSNREFLKRAGERNREWFMQYSGNADIRECYLDVLAVTAAGYRFDYSESPLRAPLTQAEKIYHEEQLHAAPEFPNYFN
jgi:glycosyltransferase involved in cell wall biosynthesis